jgi:gamma-glutamylputrescine oxidase
MEHVRSYWQGDAGDEPEPLRGDHEADVVVIGGGLAGLSSAFHLLGAHPGLDLVVLESRRIGFGGSGRNAGIVETPLLMPMWLFDGALPAPEHRWALACLWRRGQREIEHWCGPGAPSEVRRSRVLVSGASRFAGQALRHAREQLEQEEVPARWLERGEAEASCLAPSFGALDLDGSSVNPMGLVRQLAQAVRDGGGRVYEGTRVTHLAAGSNDRVELQTAAGACICARVAVVCTGAWTNELQVPKRPPVYPMATYMVASEVLDEAAIQSLGGDACCVSEMFSGTYRRVHEGRLLFGGTGSLLRRLDTSAEFDQRRVAKLLGLLGESLPSFKGVRFEQSWGGPTSTTRHTVPVVEVHPQVPGIVFNAGFHTFVPAPLSGAMVRGLVLGAAHVDDEAERLRRAYSSTRVPWVRLSATLARALGRSLVSGPLRAA